MKNILLIVCLLLGIGVQAQVKIGDNPQNIDPSAVLELESTSKVLVITRVTTDQMNAITPPSGALVYNTDLGCLHYYKDAEWVNVCDSVAEPLSISAGDSTIVITPNNNAYEITVGEIRGDQIVDATIFGQDLANGSITQAKLGLNSVGPAQLRENSVGNTQLAELSVAGVNIIDGTVQPKHMQPGGFNQLLFTNDKGQVLWVSREQIGATIADQQTIKGKGIAADPLKVADTVMQRIAKNEKDLNLKENLINKSDNTNLGTSDIKYPTQRAVKLYVDNKFDEIGGAVDDNQELSLNESNILAIERGNSVDLSLYQQSLTRSGNTISLSNGGGNIDLSDLGGGGGGGGEGGVDGAITKVELNNANLQFTGINGGFSGAINLANMPGYGAISKVELNGNNLVFTGNGKAFNGTIPLPSGGGSGLYLDEGELSGAGTESDPLRIKPAAGTLQYLITDENQVVRWEPIPEATGGGSGTVKADGKTITGTGAEGNEFRINPNIPGRFLTTDPISGEVVWADLPPGTGGGGGGNNTVDPDGITIMGDGSVDNRLRVKPGNPNQILRTNADGSAVNWVDFVLQGGENVTVEGNGTLAKPYVISAPNGGEGGGTENQTISAFTFNETTNELTLSLSGGSTGTADLTSLSGGGGDTPNLESILTTGQSAGSKQIKDLLNPTEPQDAATKDYVDSSTSQLTNLAFDNTSGILTLTNPATAGNKIDLSGLGGGTDNQQLTLEAGNILTLERGGSVDLSSLNGEGGSDGAITLVELNDSSLNFTGSGNGFTGSIDLSALPGGGADQDLASVLAGGTDAGEKQIKNLLNPSEAQDAATKDYVDSSTTQLTDLSYDNENHILTLTNPATAGKEIDLSGLLGGSNSLIVDGSILTGEGIEGNPLKIAPSSTPGQILKTDLNGDVIWDDLPAGTGNTVITDGETINGNGVDIDLSVPTGGITTLQILDGTILSEDISDKTIELAKIKPLNGPLSSNQMLITNSATGEVEWTPVNASGGGEVNTGINIGSAGIGTYVDNLGSVLQFRNINSGTGIVTVTEDPVNNNIDLDIAPTSITGDKIANESILAQHFNNMGATDGQILKWDATANAGIGGWILAEDRTDGSGIQNLNNGKILIGDNGNNPIEIDISGDATLNNTGVLTIENEAVTTAKIAPNAIETQHLSDMGATDGQILKWDATVNAGTGGWILAEDRTDGSGIQNLNNGKILIGDNDNNPIEIDISGDATLDNTGVLTIADEVIETKHLSDMGAADGQILKWDATVNAGLGGWILAEDRTDG
ncbi:beta strand repeat-containing protein, partial [Arenibacter certesii]